MEFAKKVVNLYENHNKSIRQIASIVGCSPSKIRNHLIKSGANMRSAAEGMRIFQENDIPLTPYALEVITGELLGDGGLQPKTHQSRFCFGNKIKAYSQYLWDVFDELDMSLMSVKKETYYHKYHDKWYTRYIFRTKSSIQLHQLERNWYRVADDGSRIKILPPDIFITPTVMLHWHLGDGTNAKGKYIVLCSENFTKNENETLIELINREINIKSSLMKYGKGFRIFIPKTSIPNLLEYMGSTPIPEYGYKWAFEPIGRMQLPIYISKEDLYKHYIIQNESRNKLAKRFNCSKALIDKKLRLYGIRKYRRNNED